jgi:hypothetical protein
MCPVFPGEVALIRPFLASVIGGCEGELLTLLVTELSFGRRSLGERLKPLATIGDKWLGFTGMAGRSTRGPAPDKWERSLRPPMLEATEDRSLQL